MKKVRTVLLTFGGIFLAALLIAALAPRATRAVAAALVQVANTSANPVPVTDVGPLQPFTARCTNTVANVSFVDCSVAVPAGKRLVLQMVSLTALIDNSNTVVTASVQYFSQGNPEGLEFDLTRTGTFVGLATFVRAQPVTAYVDSGSNVDCTIQEDLVGTNNTISCTLVGNLVNQ